MLWLVDLYIWNTKISDWVNMSEDNNNLWHTSHMITKEGWTVGSVTDVLIKGRTAQQQLRRSLLEATKGETRWCVYLRGVFVCFFPPHVSSKQSGCNAFKSFTMDRFPCEVSAPVLCDCCDGFLWHYFTIWPVVKRCNVTVHKFDIDTEQYYYTTADLWIIERLTELGMAADKPRRVLTLMIPLDTCDTVRLCTPWLRETCVSGWLPIMS